MADPGFPVGGGANLQRIHFSAKTYAKTKEIDPVGGAPLDPPMHTTTVLRVKQQLHNAHPGWESSRHTTINLLQHRQIPRPPGVEGT